MTMSKRNVAALMLALISLALLWPGLTQPALTIRVTMTFFGQTKELSNQTRSVLGAVRSLHQSGDNFVAGLILLFSVLVPFTKALLLIPIFAMRGTPASERLYRVVRAISKWSMADVFAVGMLIALLVMKGTANFEAAAGTGFFCFAAYCLVSNASFQLLEQPSRSVD